MVLFSNGAPAFKVLIMLHCSIIAVNAYHTYDLQLSDAPIQTIEPSHFLSVALDTVRIFLNEIFILL